MRVTVTALVAVAGELTAQITRLETDLAEHFEMHPDAKIIRSLPGLGMILGARVLAEFGDDPNRYDTHHRALRALANRLVGILHGCLDHTTLDDEHTAWAHRAQLAA